MIRLVGLVLIAISGSAYAERPQDWLFRAAPGLGYAWDNAAICTMQGRMFIGGFALEHDVADGVFVGGATTILFNTLLPDGPCGVEDGLRLGFATVTGPSIEWYPYEKRGLQLFALAGYAEIDPAMGELVDPGRGVGGTLGIGWDWHDAGSQRPDLRYGVRLQFTVAHTTGAVEHHALAPSIVATLGAD